MTTPVCEKYSIGVTTISVAEFEMGGSIIKGFEWCEYHAFVYVQKLTYNHV